MHQTLRLQLAAAGLLCLSCSSSNSSNRDASTARDGSHQGDSGHDHQHADARVPADAKAPAPEGGSVTNDAAPADAGKDAAVPPPEVVATYVYQGGYDPGVRTFSLNRETGALTQLGSPVDLGPSPSFITPNTGGLDLYIANEDNAGGVTAASIGSDHLPTRLELAQVDANSSSQNYMVFTSLSPNGKYVLAASYNGGSVSVFPVETDKKLGSVVDTVTFDPGAQSHSVRVHASGKWAFVPNKGLDSIAQLKFDQSSGQLTPNTPAQKTTASGAGPRHIAFSPNGKFAYVINENNSTLSAFRVSSAGLLEDIETESTLPSSFSGSNTAAHVLVHPNGKYVYGSNRGADNIVVFALANDGSMTLVEFESTRGTTPRNFDIDSEGKVLVVANQGSGSLAVFSIGSDGKLSPLGDVLNGLTQPNAVAIVNVTSE